MNTYTVETKIRDVALVDGVGSPRSLHVAYIVSLFPCWSETFIAEEIHQLVSQGADIDILSLKPTTEEQVHDLSRALLERVRYPGSILSLLASQLAALVSAPGVYLKQFWTVMRSAGTSPREVAKCFATFIIATYFARELKNRGVDRIHAHWATYPATAAWTINLLTGIPFSFTAHAHDIYRPDALLQKKLEAANFVITISEYNRRLLRATSDNANVLVIHCGVDPEKFPAITRSSCSPVKLISVGRLVPIKGFDILIEACAMLRDRGIDFECEIVGEGPLRAELDRQIGRQQLQRRVKLSGFCTQDNLREKLRSSTVFVLACQENGGNDRDGIPVALMEPMSMQLPVVSTYVSGVPELVENERSGLLVPAGDPIALADAIEKVVTNVRLADQLAEEGRRTVVEHFNVIRNAQRLMGLFTQ